jgi:hypothetical protein
LRDPIDPRRRIADINKNEGPAGQGTGEHGCNGIHFFVTVDQGYAVRRSAEGVHDALTTSPEGAETAWTVLVQERNPIRGMYDAVNDILNHVGKHLSPRFQ